MTSELLSILNKRFRFLKEPEIGNGQECAYEGINRIVDTLCCPEVFNLCENLYEVRVRCPSCSTLVLSPRDKNYQINMYTLAPPTTQEEFQIWMRYHTSTIDVYKCEKCKASSKNVERVEVLKRLGEVMIISLNKYMTKSNTYFPQNMAFPSSGNILHYKLIAKVEHSGSYYGGHYWSNCTRQNKVYSLNDSSISDITLDDMSLKPTMETFIIIYHMTHITKNNIV
jgi:ubiquitin C-terminal hydrolase